jgi:hypothetical protein
MPPQSQYDPGFVAFGGGSTSSVLHPAVLSAMIILILLIFLLPRRWVIVPLLLGILLTPLGQNIYIGGVHLFVSRIFVLIGCGRVLLSKPSGRFFPATFAILDKLFFIWAVYRAAAIVLLVGTGAIVNQVGFLLDALGGYFLFRSLIRDEHDVERVVKVFAIVALVSAAEMIREHLTGQNLFGMLGGIRATPDFREGKIRAQAAFAISIAAGTFGATAFPLFLWLWKRGIARATAIAGAVSSSIMVFASASSTPIMAWLGAILAVLMWPIRKQMRLVRWGIVFALLGLQVVMKSPVWFLISHIDIGGGSSWERANLLDTCIRHFGDWWLIGTRDNANWGWDMWDQCNQFVSEAENGGLVVLICFIAMFVFCFKRIGIARKAVEGNRSREWQFWLLGVMMFAQILSYMGIDYFDQSKFVWYALLAIIPAATVAVQASIAKKPKPILVGEPTDTPPVPEPSEAISPECLAGTSISRQLFE